MSDYKRRVSSTATVKASYEARLTTSGYYGGSSSHSFSPMTPSRSRVQGLPNKDGSGILGLAAGGQMYDGRDLRLLSFHLSLEQSAENIP